MNYFEITAKCEEVNESSYTIQSTGEIVTKIQLSLVVPSMRDRVLCEIPLEKAPTTDQMSTWELEESWLVVSADGMRLHGFLEARPVVRPGNEQRHGIEHDVVMEPAIRYLDPAEVALIAADEVGLGPKRRRLPL